MSARRSKLPGHSVWWWATGSITAIALCLVFFWWGAEIEDDADSSFWLTSDMFRPLVASDAARSIVASLALIVLVWCIGRGRLRALAKRPGAIEIAPLANKAPVTDEELALLDTEFRNRLADVQLYAPSPVPGNAPPSHLFDLAQDQEDPKNVPQTILRFLSYLSPTAAYEVRPVLVYRKLAPSCGVSVEVRQAPRFLRAPVTVWANTWPDAVEQAATASAGRILPWTKRVRRPPWTDWQGREMPDGLLHNYLRAKELVGARRYDEALGAFTKALELDPANLFIRFELGHVQNKLALWLDALETNLDIIEIADGRLRTGWRKKPGLRVLRWCSPRCRAWRTARLLAEYRVIILLGWSNKLGAQWAKGPAEDEGDGNQGKVEGARGRGREGEGEGADPPRKRDGERKELKTRLLVALARYEGLSGAAEAEGSNTAWADGAGDTAGVRFAQLGSRRVRQATRRWSQRRPYVDEHLWAKALGTPLRRWQVLDIWAELRQTIAECRKAEPVAELRQTVAECRKAETVDDLPRSEIEKKVSTALRGRWWQIRQPSWVDHYNAVCVYAAPLPLLAGTTGSDEEARSWAEAAVDELERVVERMDVETLAEYRSWMAHEDPDLTGLRPREEFRRFISRTFPAEAPPLARPPDQAHLIELAMHTTGMCRRSARLIEQAWHDREQCDEYRNPHHAEAAWREERDFWAGMASMGRDHNHWQTRLRLIEAFTAWCARSDRDCPPWAVPDYGDIIDSVPDSPHEDVYEGETSRPALLDACDRAFHRLADVLGAPESIEAEHDPWNELFKALDRRGMQVDRTLWRELCVSRAALWRQIGEFLEPGSSRSDAADTFRGAIRDDHAKAVEALRRIEETAAEQGEADRATIVGAHG